MRYASLTRRIGADTSGKSSGNSSGNAPDPWEVHFLAQERLAAGEDITLLSIGQEVDERTPANVVEAAVDSLHAGAHHYADVSGLPKLRSAIARYHERLTRQSLDEGHVTVFAGAQNALFSTAQVLLEPGDEVVLVSPWYTTYPATFSASGAKVVCVETTAANEHRLDARAITDAFTSRTRALVLNVPSNPVGRCPDQDTFARIVAACIEHRVWLVLDTVYLDIVPGGNVPLPHDMPGAEEILITIGSLSKSHRMTGWRIGWAAGPAPLARHFANLSMCMHYGLPPFVMEAAVHAIEAAADTPTIVQSALQSRRECALQALGDVSPARLLDSGQGMFILLDVSPLGIDARRFALALLDRHDVAVLPCDGFGPGGETLVRIGLCVDGDRLGAACAAVRRCIVEYAEARP